MCVPKMRKWKAVSIKQVWAGCRWNVNFQQNRNNSEVWGWVSAAWHTVQCFHQSQSQNTTSGPAAAMGPHQIYPTSTTGAGWGSASVIFLVPSFVLSPQICLADILLQQASINPQRIHLGSTSRMEMLWPLDVDNEVHILMFYPIDNNGSSSIFSVNSVIFTYFYGFVI